MLPKERERLVQVNSDPTGASGSPGRNRSLEVEGIDFCQRNGAVLEFPKEKRVGLFAGAKGFERPAFRLPLEVRETKSGDHALPNACVGACDDDLHLRSHRGAVAAPNRFPISGMFREREFFGFLLVYIDADSGRLVNDHVAILVGWTATEHLARFVVEEKTFLDAEVADCEIEVRVDRVPTGDGSPGPCQALRTLKNSASVAIFRAGERPPASLMWTRIKSIKRPVMSGVHSCGLLKSSPIAIGTVVCWRKNVK